MAKTTKLCPGFKVRNKVAIYGGSHWSLGAELWPLFIRYTERYPKDRAWLEFSSLASYEYWEDGVCVEVAPAHMTGIAEAG